MRACIHRAIACFWGGAVVAASALYDIATAPRAARDYKEDHGIQARLVPAVGPGGEQVGLTLRVRF